MSKSALDVKAYAKLNISLDVTARRPDGYHDVLTVMQSVELHDDIEIRRSPGRGARVVGDIGNLPRGGRNTAAGAVFEFFSYTGITEEKITVELYKRIPVRAGMGGGSADAAAVLRGLDEMFETGLAQTELAEIGSRIGSDVPFCVMNGAALAEGRGEMLTKLPSLPECCIVICKPRFSVSTRTLFGRLDCGKIQRRPDTAGITDALKNGSLTDAARRMYNIFEDVIRHGDEIARIKGALLGLGALGAVMTGTGSAVFGIFDDGGAARTARETLRREYVECFLTSPHP
ncbi:MAG: 4-(cytidine 5'-diphospho)-2-C-methyl-D-erythritol kinase [Oscillospiraceae bacterium]|nr:4-(cytidine 5'-diphospho)-2-C-methyl-D-erythritol kinase [Oscillospiraceae bacterium]